MSPLGLGGTAVPYAGLQFGTELGTGTSEGQEEGTEKVTGWSASKSAAENGSAECGVGKVPL